MRRTAQLPEWAGDTVVCLDCHEVTTLGRLENEFSHAFGIEYPPDWGSPITRCCEGHRFVPLEARTDPIDMESLLPVLLRLGFEIQEAVSEAADLLRRMRSPAPTCWPAYWSASQVDVANLVRVRTGRPPLFRPERSAV